MGRKRKYEEVKGYWVYTIKVPSINKYYVGVSKTKCHKRWIKFNYKGKSLEPYLNEWDSMIKTVLIDGLTKDEAYKYEGNIIQALSMNNLCINKQRSGLIEVSDKNAYHKQYREDNKEKHKQLCKQWNENNKEYKKTLQKQWYNDNREREIQRAKQWQKDNKEKKREYDKQRYERKKLEKQQNQ